MLRCQALTRVLVRQWVTSTPPRSSLLAARWASHDSVSVNEVRKGQVLFQGGEYWAVKDWQPAKQGRGAASYEITYDELITGKRGGSHKFGSGTRVTLVVLDKNDCEVMYTSGEGSDKIVVIADVDFNEMEIPLTRFHGISPKELNEGTKVHIYTDGDTLVQVTLR
mmetsp:Transcript_21496/g.54910  ORF Transcript_21496/g.54910 Transcript_21496/m.54910 type:complete len:166 (-) Transcript_21496:94-591(-)|eukprot:CAMPEP_0183435666 /NCGR_PEP_ID=MMETSP0370-20130417/68747_1 /TAXON_ID=268820 /ORGANISM="Peridinium aciculiferum, Strain PAER-2" /LENGTH=165 /DNA_ID=CAMNT_0025622845 /DNA_START=82 /DNA_END=579 /DNA_ORIENTATION=+